MCSYFAAPNPKKRTRRRRIRSQRPQSIRSNITAPISLKVAGMEARIRRASYCSVIEEHPSDKAALTKMANS